MSFPDSNHPHPNSPAVFTDLEVGLVNPSSVLALDLTGHTMLILDPRIGQMANLQRLVLRKVGLTELPDWIGELKALEYLDLRQNQLKELPSSMGALEQLEEVNLEQNSLQEFPDILLECKRLRRLMLGHNAIKRVGEAHRSVIQPLFVSFRYNPLEVFPWTLGTNPDLRLDMAGTEVMKLLGLYAAPLVFDIGGMPAVKEDEKRLRAVFMALAVKDFERAKGIALRADYYEAMRHDHDRLRELALEGLTHFLPNPFSHPPLPKRIQLVGDTEGLELNLIAKKLTLHGYHLLSSRESHPDVVVIGMNPDPELVANLPKTIPVASWEHFEEFVEILGKSWLHFKKVESPSVAQNLKRLLQSGNDDQIQMGIQMLESGGMIPEVLSEVLAFAIFGNRWDLLRLKAKDWFRKTASTQFRREMDLLGYEIPDRGVQKYLNKVKACKDLDQAGFARVVIHLSPGYRKEFKAYMTWAEVEAYLTRGGALDVASEKGWDVLPPGITEVTKLTKFRLCNCGLAQVPAGISHIRGLENLDLSFNAIPQLPDEMRQMRGLKVLNLQSNKLKLFPPQIADFTQLEYLDLSLNQIRSIDLDLGGMRALKKLYIGACQFVEPPEALFGLPALSDLNLDRRGLGKSIRSLSGGIGNLTALENLSVRGNLLQDLPSELSKLQLVFLDLSQNRFKTLPAAVYGIPTLRWLWLSGCDQLTTLDEAIGDLSALEELFLQNTGLTALPSTLPRLRNLKRLNLGNCQVADMEGLWRLIDQMPALQRLDLPVRLDHHQREVLKRRFPWIPNIW